MVMDMKPRYKVRRVVSRGTPSYQLGHYEMTGKPGARRSRFKVLVHLGEHETPEAARIEAKMRKLEGAISDRTEAR
jgi:hypothetical protein